MENKEDANGSVRQMEDFSAEQPTADRAGLLAAAEGTTNGNAQGDGPTPKSPDGVSASSVESGSEVSPLHMDQEKSKAGTWHAEGLKVIIVSCIVFSLSVTVALVITIYYGPPQVSPHGAVASSSTQCSKVGTDILQEKGSAVDAAIAAVVCESVVSSHLTGIGGGGFMIYRDHKNKKTITIDFREVAPESATTTMYQQNPSDKRFGPKSVAVPGLLRGLEAAHKKYGKKPWRDLIMPAVNLARNGFNTTQYLVDAINDHLVHGDPNERIKNMYLIDGKAPKAGDTLKFPLLADTLEIIANKGAEEFYSGQMAKDIADDVTEDGGILSFKDLKSYAVTSSEPIESTFKNLTLQTLPPPAGGAAVLTILNVMDLYGVTKENKTHNLTYHRFVEAMKFAEALHDSLGDPQYVSILNITKDMVSKEHAEQIKSKIDDTNVLSPEDYGTLATSDDHGTSHVSVLGPDEEMVSLTSTINDIFGSQYVTTNGILLNNEMDDFSISTDANPNENFLLSGKRPLCYASPIIVFSKKRPCAMRQAIGGSALGGNNYIAPKKRPLSSMSPIVVFSKTQACATRMALGGTNGHNITLGVAEVLLNAIGFGDSLEDAVSAKRLSPDRMSNTVHYEDGMDESLVAELTKLGHEMKKYDGNLSTVNVVGKINETVTAESDSRAGGKASIF